MCILKVYSDTDSFKSFEKTTKVPVYSSYDKGESKGKSQVRADYKISFDISGKDWDDFEGQVEDSINFLAKYYDDIEQLFKTHSITTAYLDFPLYSRLYGDIVNQNNHLPKELIVLAGKLSLGIEMAIYSKDAFDRDID
ncbi:MAG TPA: hypothetical protein DEO70_06655 [Bacteroidales bacterium]|nr:MAG: hypothetical protein A2X11_08695 [Bacteroidetes bacterium GWE2_42_24]OFY31862.1 MAG: hypothetical protein A2X09_09790 [Bacteroidetes bacterium GWF2_43_11]HBZ66500.1 hypothetical protein [Bacteroidales bacterium]